MQFGPNNNQGSHRPVALAPRSPSYGSVGPFLFGLVLLGLIVLLGALQPDPARRAFHSRDCPDLVLMVTEVDIDGE